MLKGNRKEYRLRKSQTLELENFVDIFLHNQGSSSVLFGDYEIAASKTHQITSPVALTENIDVVFSSTTDNNLYVQVISVKNCN